MRRRSAAACGSLLFFKCTLSSPNGLYSSGCLGTEETLLTMAYYRRPDLFHVHHNFEDRSDPFPQSDDVCYFVWERTPAKVSTPDLSTPRDTARR
jgi:hypothetical protein